MSIADEQRPKRQSSFGDSLKRIIRGVGVGALAAGSGVAAILLLLTFFTVLSLGSSLDGLIITFLVGVGFILLAGLLGAVAGLLVAIVDRLVGGRLYDGRMPFWAWLPIGGLLGAMVFIVPLPFGSEEPPSLYGTIFLVILGALSGLVAGPVFGWLYRQPREVEG
jgi:hypothetical protein